MFKCKTITYINSFNDSINCITVHDNSLYKEM